MFGTYWYLRGCWSKLKSGRTNLAHANHNPKIGYSGPLYWTPTMGLRWKASHDDESIIKAAMGHGPKKVLQQLWQCSDGQQEWRDVPFEP